MEKIYLITDYLNRFSSKFPAIPYRSGMDKMLLIKEFAKIGYEAIFLNYTDIDFQNSNYQGKIILYTSSEDYDLHYKSYIEDIILGLETQGATIIPDYKFLRAHHNKVFMEIMRDQSSNIKIKNIKSRSFGTIEDLLKHKNRIEFPGVFKTASGSTSTGVREFKSFKELLTIAKSLGRSRSLKHELWDLGRALRHKRYKKESLYRRKFVVQNFITNLDRDWKILVFGNKYYILERKVRKDDFRASGSGIFRFTSEIPEGILDFANDFYESLNLPFVAMDIAFDGNVFYLIEFQALYFGTVTLQNSPFYFEKRNTTWCIVNKESILETEFALSVVNYLRK